MNTTIQEASPDLNPSLAALLGQALGPIGDMERFNRARKWVNWAVNPAGATVVPGGVAVVETPADGTWYLWLMAVRPDLERRGIGRALFDAVEAAARRSCARCLRVQTYRRWERMLRIVKARRWMFVGATLGARNDQVKEEWVFPLRPTPLRMVVVGANPEGRGGEWIAAIRRDPGLAELVGVCDADAHRRAAWLGVDCDGDLAVLLGRVKAEAVILALPHTAYADARRICIEAGVAMLHEKPLACSMTELLKLHDQLIEKPCAMVVGVQRRSHPSYVFLRGQLATAKVRPATLTIRMRLGRPANECPRDWRVDPSLAGGGALLDLGYHAMDLAQFLLDAPLQVVACNLWTFNAPAREGEIETAARVVARCGPTWVCLDIDRHGGEKVEWVELALEDTLICANRETVTINGQTAFACDERWEAALQGRLAELVMVRDQPPRPPDLWDQLGVLQVVEQAYSQARQVGLGQEGTRHG
ncbi:MAG: GNAT family N-acetyltransferase [Verrucomicrobia bacterium]|nr:GNAT family N-acetyltransferase [Verrucomicrobiota bacterium]